MAGEIVYMLGVVFAVFAVNYALRALPFVLFGGRDRNLPQWVASLGSYISPIIILALIVYSYSGLRWRTPWPYLAGALTVALHLWRRNPLASIVAGTVLYMCLVGCGCTTAETSLAYDGAHPLIRFSNTGIRFKDEYVTPSRAIELLEENQIPHDATIHILVDDDYTDRRATWVFQHNYLARAGYSRSVLVSKRVATSAAVDSKPRRAATSAHGKPQKIRYKKADE